MCVLFAHWPNAPCVCVYNTNVCINDLYLSFPGYWLWSVNLCCGLFPPTGQVPRGLWAGAWPRLYARIGRPQHGALPESQSDDGRGGIQQRDPPPGDGAGQTTRRHHCRSVTSNCVCVREDTSPWCQSAPISTVTMVTTSNFYWNNSDFWDIYLTFMEFIYQTQHFLHTLCFTIKAFQEFTLELEIQLIIKTSLPPFTSSK